MYYQLQFIISYYITNCLFQPSINMRCLCAALFFDKLIIKIDNGVQLQDSRFLISKNTHRTVKADEQPPFTSDDELFTEF